VNRLWKPISLAAGMLLLSGILMWAGCASGGGKTRFRFMNAMPDQNSLNILINPTVNTTPVFSNIAYGTASAYTAVSSGSQPFEIEAAGTTNSLKSGNISFTSGADTTVIAANFTVNATVLPFTDDNSTPATNNFNLRIINVAPFLGTTGPGIDVYVEPQNTDITTVNATVSGLTFQSASNYLPIAGGTWDITVTAHGSKNFAFPPTGDLSFTAGQVRTFVVINSQGGGGTYALLSDLN